ncbi:hypothetical protein DL240_11400 [Lujinxingia litoralis]|uniref:Uncharacterized protein n=1 Tax=Lujinxingia litoralis TaxID=2211119 RepID=A0A328C7R0_9DELT|nr:hypothetical protein DL240_11400 [Lujinxingia litoralis]
MATHQQASLLQRGLDGGWEGEAGAAVRIDDVDGEHVVEGSLDDTGSLEVPFMQMTIRPAEWEEGAGEAVGQWGRCVTHRRSCTPRIACRLAERCRR